MIAQTHQVFVLIVHVIVRVNVIAKSNVTVPVTVNVIAKTVGVEQPPTSSFARAGVKCKTQQLCFYSTVVLN